MSREKQHDERVEVETGSRTHHLTLVRVAYWCGDMDRPPVPTVAVGLFAPPVSGASESGPSLAARGESGSGSEGARRRRAEAVLEMEIEAELASPSRAHATGGGAGGAGAGNGGSSERTIGSAGTETETAMAEAKAEAESETETCLEPLGRMAFDMDMPLLSAAEEERLRAVRGDAAMLLRLAGGEEDEENAEEALKISSAGLGASGFAPRSKQELLADLAEERALINRMHAMYSEQAKKVVMERMALESELAQLEAQSPS